MATVDDIKLLIEASGKYTILSTNRDGMNSVAFHAKHNNLDLDVFLKVYRASSHTTGLFSEPQMLVEATGKRARPGNLVAVRDAILINSDLVLLELEYINGGSVEKAIQNNLFGQMDAVRMATGLLRGVSELHCSNLVHRDIKPANILLANVGYNTTPKLGDFGSVSKISSINGQTTVSKISVFYAPPESWGTPSSYSILSDVYQVGIVLHEMVNGLLPTDPTAYLDKVADKEIIKRGGTTFQDLSAIDQRDVLFAAVERYVTKKGKLLNQVPTKSYVSHRLKMIINKATNLNPLCRYKTALEFIGDLTLTLPNWKSHSLPDTYEALDWNKRNYLVKPAEGKKNCGMFAIKRTGVGGNKYQVWKLTNCLKEAFKVVEIEGIA